jgi:hypothetical protein
MQRLAIVVLVLVLGGAAHADTRWHAGLNLRADLGTHPIRVGGGVQFEHCRRAWGLFGGWRTSAIGILGGTQFQQKLLVGIGAPLPQLGPFRARWSFEIATVIVKHGADLPSDWISFASGRDFIDLVNFGMFVSIEYGKAI